MIIYYEILFANDSGWLVVLVSVVGYPFSYSVGAFSPSAGWRGAPSLPKDIFSEKWVTALCYQIGRAIIFLVF